ncbi:GAF domain-containing protein [Sphingomonas sp.]|uniref:GAF domain-containing protein n=1 Tax=Sphingomonas sp. TaxID=28214 RepID=UPI0028B0400C|nr:GAF domain-containing protein [Sphingomonas sp.]
MTSERVDALRAYGILDTPPDPAFEGIVQLAGQICSTPVALISLVDSDRQWFKARAGFPLAQTGLDQSVCRFVVQDAAPIIIPDLTADARTRDNPLVTEDPNIRFYAGVPLITGTGQVLGALCAIDLEPRPEGLSEFQTSALMTLAQQTVEAIELRRSVREHQTAIADCERARVAQADADRRWQALFQSLREGFIVGQLVRDESGRVVDWRYEAVNEAWGELVGVPCEKAIGRTIREVFPGIEDDWVMEFADVVASGEPARFTRQVGTLERWYDGICQAIDSESFSVLFVEVTERFLATRRREALLRLDEVLRDSSDIHAMQSTVAELVGTTLEASCVAYGEIDDLENVVVEAEWSAPGMPSVIGRYSFADFGNIHAGLARGEPLIIVDTKADSRTSAELARWEALKIRSSAGMPVIDQGRTTALLLVHFNAPHRWTDDELGFIRAAADRLQIRIARLRTEQQQAVLNGEILHRLKNSLAMVQAIASQTFKGSAEPGKVRAFSQRLQTLSTAHDVLFARDLQSADLRQLIEGVLQAAGADGRYEIAGPEVRLGTRATLSTSLLVHELATNASKYGSWSVDEGRVSIIWHLEGEGDSERLLLRWREKGGPPAIEPARKGFGSKLLTLGLIGTGGSSLYYTETGFEAEFQATKREVREG